MCFAVHEHSENTKENFHEALWMLWMSCLVTWIHRLDCKYMIDWVNDSSLTWVHRVYISVGIYISDRHEQISTYMPWLITRSSNPNFHQKLRFHFFFIFVIILSLTKTEILLENFDYKMPINLKIVFKGKKSQNLIVIIITYPTNELHKHKIITCVDKLKLTDIKLFSYPTHAKYIAGLVHRLAHKIQHLHHPFDL